MRIGLALVVLSGCDLVFGLTDRVELAGLRVHSVDTAFDYVVVIRHE